jgi:tellurite resistance protein
MSVTRDDASTILAIGAMAALADGTRDAAELARLSETATTLGLTNADELMRAVASSELTVPTLAARLSSSEARQLAYDTAAAICHADGWVNPSESAFLQQLARAVGANVAETTSTASAVRDAVAAPVPTAGAAADPRDAAARPALDAYILDQAIVTAGLELLPDRLANLGILPLQLRIVQQIGARHGQQLDLNQVKDLAATLGLGAAAQLLEASPVASLAAHWVGSLVALRGALRGSRRGRP